jgi:hypothetical protein
LWVITTKHWKRFYSPPSVFEYLATSIVTIILQSLSSEFQNEELRKSNALEMHNRKIRRGCLLDYTEDKLDRRILISNPNLCYDCRYKLSSLEISINENLGKDKCIPLIKDLDRVISRGWVI